MPHALILLRKHQLLLLMKKPLTPAIGRGFTIQMQECRFFVIFRPHIPEAIVQSIHVFKALIHYRLNMAPWKTDVSERKSAVQQRNVSLKFFAFAGRLEN